MKRVLILIVWASVSFAGELPAVLKQPALQHFYNLEFDEALAIFHAEAAAHPESPDVQNLIAQAVIFRTMFLAGALDTGIVSDQNPFFDRPKAPMMADDEKLFLDSLNRALELSRVRLAKDANDRGALYATGVAYGLRADYDFIVRKAWVASLRDFTQARKYHSRVTDLDPARADARLTQGMLTYISGNLVFPWKQLGFLAGFHGDKEAGIRILREVQEKGEYNKVDAAIFLGAIYRRDHRSAEAIPLAQELIAWFPRNFQFRMELARLFNDVGDRRKALAVITEIEDMKKSDAPGYKRLSDDKIRELRQLIERSR